MRVLKIQFNQYLLSMPQSLTESYAGAEGDQEDIPTIDFTGGSEGGVIVYLEHPGGQGPKLQTRGFRRMMQQLLDDLVQERVDRETMEFLGELEQRKRSQDQT